MQTDKATSTYSSNLRIGQIRRISIEPYGTVLVCIAQVFSAANLAEVIVVHAEPERAISRDFIAESDGANLLFALVLAPDLVFSLNLSVLDESRTLGQICQQCVTELFRQSFLRILPEKYHLDKNHDCLYSGNYEMNLMDRSWIERSKLIDALGSLSLDYLDYSDFVDERVRELTLLSVAHHGRVSHKSFISNPNNVEIIESLEYVLERVSSNPYARNLVRC